MRWIIFLPGTYCVQYQWMNEAAGKRLHQDNMYIYPSKLQMWTCVHSSKCEMFSHRHLPGLVTWPDTQWQRLRSPGCWRWKTLCWTPWRTRFCRWMAFRAVWCRSTQLRPFGPKLSGAAWAKALSWETEAAAARPEGLPVWFWGSGSNALKTQACTVCECVRPENVFLAVQIKFYRHTGWRF